jgi:hypothetical protein
MATTHEQHRLIVDTIVEFVGEHTGRLLVYKLIGTGRHFMQDGRIHVTLVYENLDRILKMVRDKLTTGIPYLLQVVYDNHYTGIRIEYKVDTSTFKVYLVDPAESTGLYTPLPLMAVELVKNIFNVKKVYKAVACQLNAEDTFCQTWSLILLSNPAFEVNDKTAFILDLYKRIVVSPKFVEWLSSRNGVTVATMNKIRRWSVGQFTAAIR